MPFLMLRKKSHLKCLGERYEFPYAIEEIDSDGEGQQLYEKIPRAIFIIFYLAYFVRWD